MCTEYRVLKRTSGGSFGPLEICFKCLYYFFNTKVIGFSIYDYQRLSDLSNTHPKWQLMRSLPCRSLISSRFCLPWITSLASTSFHHGQQVVFSMCNLIPYTDIKWSFLFLACQFDKHVCLHFILYSFVAYVSLS